VASEDIFDATTINALDITDAINLDLSNPAASEIPELEKLEEDLRLEIEGSVSIPDLEIAEVEEIKVGSDVEAEIDQDIIVPLDIQDEPVHEVAAENIEANLLAENEHDRRKSGRVQAEQVRVRADLLDNLVNFAGEVSIYRSRLEQQTNNFRYNITEFDDTVNRLREQLRQFEIETETQIEYRNEERLSNAQADFDPLEMDRFTTMQHLSRAMMESLGDLDSLRGILNNLTRESETLLLQQSRVNTDLQEGLMRTRMVPFSGQAARLRRIVRQTCGELGKHAELHLDGVDSELDRSVLERIISPIEHMLRNAVAHGIESPADRKKSVKSESGNINFLILNEGSRILIKLMDDGSGINLVAIRDKAISKGLIQADTAVSKEMLLDMIMQSGFSTAESVSQIAGRGVGMDVVVKNIRSLGGSLEVWSKQGEGSKFTIRLPLTLAILDGQTVAVGDEDYIIPLISIVESIQLKPEMLNVVVGKGEPFKLRNEHFPIIRLHNIFGGEPRTTELTEGLLVVVESDGRRMGLFVDELKGQQQVVIKSLEVNYKRIEGISGATILGDGSVALIIDIPGLINLSNQKEASATGQLKKSA